jgi:hypothetical protein
LHTETAQRSPAKTLKKKKKNKKKTISSIRTPDQATIDAFGLLCTLLRPSNYPNVRFMLQNFITVVVLCLSRRRQLFFPRPAARYTVLPWPTSKHGLMLHGDSSGDLGRLVSEYARHCSRNAVIFFFIACRRIDSLSLFLISFVLFHAFSLRSLLRLLSGWLCSFLFVVRSPPFCPLFPQTKKSSNNVNSVPQYSITLINFYRSFIFNHHQSAIISNDQ